MKVYISADIEGVCGIAHWDEAESTKGDYGPFRDQMQREVGAACRGALSAGARVLRVRDGHDTGRNLDARALPREADLVREWSLHPYLMVEGLERGFDALVLIGYHAGAGSLGNPLAHTMSLKLTQMRLNGNPVAEMHLSALTAASIGVPTVFVSGDAALVEATRRFDPRIRTVATGEGRGRAVISRHPDTVVEEIESGVEEALSRLSGFTPAEMPTSFRLELDYREPKDAYRYGFYPGARLMSDRTVVFESESWLEVMRAVVFTT